MENCSRNGEACPQLLDLIPRDRDWMARKDGEMTGNGSSEEKKLELRLGPPGEDWITREESKNREREDSAFSVGYFPRVSMDKVGININGTLAHKFPSSENPSAGAAVLSSPWSQQKKGPFLQFPTNAKESSEKKPFPPASADTAVPNSSQKRTAPSVVGWPPIRSSRRNLAGNSSSKLAIGSQNAAAPGKVASERPEEGGSRKGLFVKINMDGVPIGRKVDLQAYDSYEQLSSAVDQLFRGLLAAQKDSPAGVKKQDEKPITGLLDGSGEYTLVYEDNEGDRMLVGDVPWHMFTSAAKRLRVLKSSEISALSLGSNKQQEKMQLFSGMK